MNWAVAGWTFLILFLCISGFCLALATADWLKERFGEMAQIVFWVTIFLAIISLIAGALFSKKPQPLTPEQACKVVKPQEKLK